MNLETKGHLGVLIDTSYPFVQVFFGCGGGDLTRSYLGRVLES